MSAHDQLTAIISRKKNHCRNCGRYVGDELCQCRISAIIKAARDAQQINELMTQEQPRRSVAEVACEVYGGGSQLPDRI